jgi:hypothetical protein
LAEAVAQILMAQAHRQLLAVPVVVALGQEVRLLVMVRQELLVKALLVETILVLETSKVVAEAEALALLAVMLVQH